MAKQDLWQKLVDSVTTPDGLAVRECGRWTEEKLWLWHRYLDITTKAMVDNPRWQGGLACVDLFAGPGICFDKERNRRLPGSPVIAANTGKQFRRIVCVELDPVLASACAARLAASPAASVSTVICGDCESKIAQVVAAIPQKALTLAFVDPEGLHAKFSMMQALAADRRVDFLLLFADAMDLVRNVDRYATHEGGAKLDAILGPGSNWRVRWEGLHNRTSARICSLFAQLFAEQVTRVLGYKGVREKIISGPTGPLYRLIYASKHERGLEFWDKVSAREITTQGRLF